MMMRDAKLYVLFVVLLLATLVVFTADSGPPPRVRATWAVALGFERPFPSAGCTRARAIDGDTISVVCDGERVTVRMIGFDAPDSERPGVPVECFNKQAAASLAGMVDGRRVKLVRDSVSLLVRDRYGRFLSYVEVDGKDVGRAQLRNGFARVYAYAGAPFAQERSYRSAERAAEQAGAGLWQSCGGSNHAR